MYYESSVINNLIHIQFYNFSLWGKFTLYLYYKIIQQCSGNSLRLYILVLTSRYESLHTVPILRQILFNRSFWRKHKCIQRAYFFIFFLIVLNLIPKLKYMFIWQKYMHCYRVHGSNLTYSYNCFWENSLHDYGMVCIVFSIFSTIVIYSCQYVSKKQVGKQSKHW